MCGLGRSDVECESRHGEESGEARRKRWIFPFLRSASLLGLDRPGDLDRQMAERLSYDLVAEDDG